MNHPDPASIEDVFRASSGAVTAALIRYCGDFDLAEDAVQEAFVIAVEHWRRDGLPANPGGWVATTAKRRLIDRLRRERTGNDKLRLLERVESMPVDPMAFDDDRLRLIFTCCSPALSLEVRVALTLRTVCGLSTDQIAEAFVVPESTMAQRLVRGKRKIKIAGIPYEIPPAEALTDRLSSVLAVLYLVFNAGYNARSDGDASKVHLVGEAIGVATSLDLLIPGEPEIMGLLALMLFHDARSASRVDTEGRAVLLDVQDRAVWNQSKIDRAERLVTRASGLGSVGQYWLQAAIVAEHLRPVDPASKNWDRIVALYDVLVEQTKGSAVVRLNRAIAVVEASGPDAGLAALDPLADRLASYSYFHAARAHMLDRSGDRPAAATAYQQAIDLATSEPQRRSLRRAQGRLELRHRSTRTRRGLSLHRQPERTGHDPRWDEHDPGWRRHGHRLRRSGRHRSVARQGSGPRWDGGPSTDCGSQRHDCPLRRSSGQCRRDRPTTALTAVGAPSEAMTAVGAPSEASAAAIGRARTRRPAQRGRSPWIVMRRIRRRSPL